MSLRKELLVNDGVHHIYTRSIAKFNIFRYENDYNRLKDLLFYYSVEKPACKFSKYLRYTPKTKESQLAEMSNSQKIVKVIAYCVMPTHIHLILKQVKKNGISKFMNLILKSYTSYFNTKYERLGPLWEGRFKNVLVETDEQLLHLTRYIHLNPVSVSLVNAPEKWDHSSYKEYTESLPEQKKLCDYSEYFEITKEKYKAFVNERIDTQRELQKIKHLML